MKLIADWRAALNRLWVVKAAVIGALMPVADQILAQFERYIPAWLYSLLFISIILFRVLQQKPAVDPEATAPGVK